MIGLVRGFITSLGGISALKDIPAALSLGFEALAGKIGMTTAALGSLIGVAAGIAAVAVGIHLYNKHWENLRQEADAASESFRNAQTDISGYADRIKELKDQLENDELTNEESYNIRKELLEIQGELIENYGSEAEALDLLGESAEETNTRLQKLTRTQALRALANGAKAYEEAIRAIESAGMDGANYFQQTAQLIKKYDTAAQLFNQLAARYDNITLQDGTLVVDGDAYARQEAFQAIQDALLIFDTSDFSKGDKRLWNGLTKGITSSLRSVSNVIDEFGDRYQDYIWNKIFADETGNSAEYLNYITEFSEKVKEAIVNQDWASLNANSLLLQGFRDSLLSDTSIPEQVRTYLIGLIDEAVDGISPYETILQVKLHLETTPGAKEQAIEALKVFMDENGVVDIGAIGNISLGVGKGVSALSPAYAALDVLRVLAQQSGTDVMGLIDALRALGYITTSSAASTEEATTALLGFGEALNGADEDSDSLSEQLDTMFSGIDKLESALEKLETGELTLDEVVELVAEFPELAEYVDFTAEGFGDLGKGLKQCMKAKPQELAKRLREIADSGTLTEDAATHMRNLADALDQMSTTAVEHETREFKALKDSIDAAKKAKEELDELLGGDDLDTGYNKNIDYYSKMGEYIDNQEWGSDHLVALREYFGQTEKTIDEFVTWYQSVSHFFEEGDDGINNWLDAVERMNKEGTLDTDIASFNSDTGEFYYNLDRIQELADAFDMPTEVIQDFIDKFRMGLDRIHDGLIEESEAQKIADRLKIPIEEVYDLLDRLPDPDITISSNTSDVQDRLQQLLILLGRLKDVKNQTVTITYNGPSSSFPTGKIAQYTKAKGTKHAANGTALLGDEYSSSGSPKPELVVSDGSAYLAGVNGPVFGYLKQGDVVYTADETKKILSASGRTGSIPAFAGGAVIGGKASKYAKANRGLTSNATTQAAASAVQTSAAAAGEELDWIETLLERIQTRVEALDTTFSDSFRSMESRTAAGREELEALAEQYDKSTAAATAYWAAAESVNLSDYYKDLVRNGGLSLESIADETLKDAIEKYKGYVDKALEAEQTALDVAADFAKVYTGMFDLINSEYDHIITDLDNQQKYVETQIELAEALGENVSSEYYEQMIAIEEQKTAQLNDELAGLESAFEEAVNSGAIEEGSEDWYNMREQIQGVKQEILESEVATANLRKEMVKLFDQVTKSYDNAMKVVDHTQSMLEGEMEAAEYLAHRSTGDITSEMIYNERARQTMLQDLISDTQDALQKGLASGNIKVGDDTWYEMMETIWGAEEDILEGRNKIANWEKEEFDRIESGFSNQIERIGHRATMLQTQISTVEAKGYVAGESFYKALIDNKTEEVAALEEEGAALQANLDLLVATGQVQVGSSRWYEMQSAIDSTNESIAKGRQEIAEYNKQLRELHNEQFEYGLSLISDLNSEAEFLIKLAEYSDDLVTTWDALYRAADGDIGSMDIASIGGLTEAGWAAMALHAQEYATYMEMAERYAKERADVEAALAKDPNNKELLERQRELIKLQQQAIEGTYGQRDAIKALVEEGIKAELEGMKNLIDTYKESLDSAKSLHDYQKKIEKQTQTISTIQKQLSAYAGDDSEETRKTIQQLKQDLIEAQEDLEETQYEHYISDQKELLDKLYTDYETTLNKRLDDVDGLVSEVIEMVGSSSEQIWSTIQTTASETGYEISSGTAEIWNRIDSNGSNLLDAVNNSSATLIGWVQEIYNAIGAQIEEDSLRDILSEMQANSEAWWDADDVTRNYLHQRNEQLAQEYYNRTGERLYYDSASGEWRSGGGDQRYPVYGSTSRAVEAQTDTYQAVREIVKQMRANSDAWTEETGAKLADRNVELSHEIERMLGIKLYRGDDGVWYLPDGRQLYSVYHRGGVVGASLAQNEEWAKLMKGEMVLTREQARSMLSNFATAKSLAAIAADRSGGAKNNYTEITVTLPNVRNYEEFMNEMRSDKRFQGLIESISVDPINGKSVIGKNRYRW